MEVKIPCVFGPRTGQRCMVSFMFLSLQLRDCDRRLGVPYSCLSMLVKRKILFLLEIS
jgi:hypothetical protein